MSEVARRFAILWLACLSFCYAAAPPFWRSGAEHAVAETGQALENTWQHFSTAREEPADRQYAQSAQPYNNFQPYDLHAVERFMDPEPSTASSSAVEHRGSAGSSSSLQKMLPMFPRPPAAYRSEPPENVRDPAAAAMLMPDELHRELSAEQRTAILQDVGSVLEDVEKVYRVNHPRSKPASVVKFVAYDGRSLTEGFIRDTFGSAGTTLWHIKDNLYAVRARSNTDPINHILMAGNMLTLGDPARLVFVWQYFPKHAHQPVSVFRIVGAIDGYRSRDVTELLPAYRVGRAGLQLYGPDTLTVLSDVRRA